MRFSFFVVFFFSYSFPCSSFPLLRCSLTTVGRRLSMCLGLCLIGVVVLCVFSGRSTCAALSVSWRGLGQARSQTHTLHLTRALPPLVHVSPHPTPTAGTANPNCQLITVKCQRRTSTAFLLLLHKSCLFLIYLPDYRSPQYAKERTPYGVHAAKSIVLAHCEEILPAALLYGQNGSRKALFVSGLATLIWVVVCSPSRIGLDFLNFVHRIPRLSCSKPLSNFTTHRSRRRQQRLPAETPRRG